MCIRDRINPDIAGDETQYAVGFMNTFTSQNTGYAPEFGFILSYQDKPDTVSYTHLDVYKRQVYEYNTAAVRRYSHFLKNRIVYLV